MIFGLFNDTQELDGEETKSCFSQVSNLSHTNSGSLIVLTELPKMCLHFTKTHSVKYTQIYVLIVLDKDMQLTDCDHTLLAYKPVMIVF